MELISPFVSPLHAVPISLGMNCCTNSFPLAGISAFPCSNFSSPSGTTTNSPKGSCGSLCTSTPCLRKSFRVSANRDNTCPFAPLACCKALLSMATSSRMKITAREVIKSVSELASAVFSCSLGIRAPSQLFERLRHFLQPFGHRVQRRKLVLHFLGFIRSAAQLLDYLLELLRAARRDLLHRFRHR